MEINEINKKVWERIFGETPIEMEDGILSVDDEGNSTSAEPLGFDEGQKEYDAVREITESAVFTKTYKIWKGETKLYSAVTGKPINEFDVIFYLDAAWEYPVKLMLVYKINEENNSIIVKYIDYDEDEVVTHMIKYKP